MNINLETHAHKHLEINYIEVYTNIENGTNTHLKHIHCYIHTHIEIKAGYTVKQTNVHLCIWECGYYLQRDLLSICW